MHIYICYWRWLYIGRGFIVLEHSTHLVWTRRSSHDAADVIVLWITYSVNIDRQAGPCIQGGWKFLVTEIFFKNVPGLLKRMHNFFFRGGGGFWGVWGAPRPHPGVARGRKTIHFFL